MKQVISICYEINKECNLNCDYCITSDNDNKQIDYKLLINYIAFLNPKRIVISGGEPLLDPHLIDKLTMIKEMCPDSYVSLSTNGTVDYDYSLLESVIDCIDVSLPSLEEGIYKSMRGKDLLLKVKQNLDKIKLSSLDLRLSFMLTKANKYEVIDILDYATSLETKEVRVGRYFPFRGGNKCSKKYELSQDELDEVVSNIDIDSYPFKIVLPISSLQLMSDSYLTINHLGEVSTPTNEGKNILLNINENTLHEYNIHLEKQDEIFRNLTLKKIIVDK